MMRLTFWLTTAFSVLAAAMPLRAVPAGNDLRSGSPDPNWYREFVVDYNSLIFDRIPARNRYGRGGEKQSVGFQSGKNSCQVKCGRSYSKKRVKAPSLRIRRASGKSRCTAKAGCRRVYSISCCK